MQQRKSLAELQVGQQCRVVGLNTRGGMRRRFLDIGLVEGALVSCIGKSPLGDPRAYLICGATVAVRRADAEGVVVELDG